MERLSLANLLETPRGSWKLLQDSKPAGTHISSWNHTPQCAALHCTGLIIPFWHSRTSWNRSETLSFAMHTRFDEVLLHQNQTISLTLIKSKKGDTVVTTALPAITAAFSTNLSLSNMLLPTNNKVHNGTCSKQTEWK